MKQNSFIMFNLAQPLAGFSKGDLSSQLGRRWENGNKYNDSKLFTPTLQTNHLLLGKIKNSSFRYLILEYETKIKIGLSESLIGDKNFSLPFSPCLYVPQGAKGVSPSYSFFLLRKEKARKQAKLRSTKSNSSQKKRLSKMFFSTFFIDCKTSKETPGLRTCLFRSCKDNNLQAIKKTKEPKYRFLFKNEAVPCIPLEHQKSLQVSNCIVAPGALVNAGQEICNGFVPNTNFFLPCKKYALKSKTRISVLKFCRPSQPSHAHKFFLLTKERINKSNRLKLETLATPESGQVIKIDYDKVTFRRAHCYFTSSKGLLSIVNNEYVKKGNPLFNLKYEKLLTGDIVQGLGKIEELLEYPKTSLNLSFKTSLRRYLTKMSLNKAIEWSYAELQAYLVQSIQQVYVDQGCFISDKHLEIIVRQATSLGIVLFPGDTGFLHHEIVVIDKIEKINKQIMNSPRINFTYDPLMHFNFFDSNFALLKTKIQNKDNSYVSKSKNQTLDFRSFSFALRSKQGLAFAKQEGSKKEGCKHSCDFSVGRSKRGNKYSKDYFVKKKQRIENKENKNTTLVSLALSQTQTTKRQKALYYPHLKGITWNSLNSDSILSAASFQETRRVLRDNLVTDKVDFLKGIKERIILGELLEIGTGFHKNHF